MAEPELPNLPGPGPLLSGALRVYILRRKPIRLFHARRWGTSMLDRYSFFIILADVMIVISLLVIVAVLLLMVAGARDTGMHLNALGNLGGVMLYVWGTATIFMNLLFITVGAILHACVETARNTRALRLAREVGVTATVPA